MEYIDKIHENGVKDYLSHPKNYNVEIKYKQGNAGTYYPCDTVVTKITKLK